MKYKILLLNVGYFRSLDGSVRDYILKSYRYVLPSRKITSRIIGEFNKLVSSETPDIVCLMEVRKNQVRHLINGSYEFYNFETKYSPSGLARRLPVLKSQYNGVIAKKKIGFRKFFLKNGFKKLAYGLKLPGGARLILFHFALSQRKRLKQFKEIKEIVKNDRKTIICGDFNIFNGFSEIDYLTKELNLKVCPEEKTFPAHDPKRELDLFLVPRDLETKARIIKSDISDHLPVVLEINV